MEAKTLQIITNELYKYGKLIKEDEVKEVVELCQKANRIFIAGAGRSGFVPEVCKQNDASWVYGLFCWRNNNTFYSGRRSVDRRVRIRNNSKSCI